MSNEALFLTLILIIVSMVLSFWQRLDLERELLVAALRAFIQLVAIGYILTLVFNLERWYYTLLILLVMTVVAGYNAAVRGKGVPFIFWRVTGAITAGEAVTLGIMLGLHIIEFTPRFLITISGMIVGNSMVASGLVLKSFREGIIAREREVEAALALGASPKQSVEGVLRNAVKNGSNY